MMAGVGVMFSPLGGRAQLEYQVMLNVSQFPPPLCSAPPAAQAVAALTSPPPPTGPKRFSVQRFHELAMCGELVHLKLIMLLMHQVRGRGDGPGREMS